MDHHFEPIRLADSLSREFLLHHRVCPTAWGAEDTVVVAAGPGWIAGAIDDLELAYDAVVEVQPCSERDLETLIERLANRSARLLEVQAASSPSVAGSSTDIREIANQAPVIRYVNLLLREAHSARASDVHVEGSDTGPQVRFRRDGVLSAGPDLPAELHLAVVSRLKLLADLDIAERRRPQDGRMRVRVDDGELDVRVSTVPTIEGESVALRLLSEGARPVSVAELGLSHSMRQAVEGFARAPRGLVLVTGPTGSGKTTTLYSLLRLRSLDREKIVTIEDPVEYRLEGVTQVPVRSQAGVTFASALRSILRQDPDVVLVGEMRDAETAEIAVQAALTGHLVLSTLHTNDAPGAVIRMIDLGIPSFLIDATLSCVVAQRLVRRVCRGCTSQSRPSSGALEALRLSGWEGDDVRGSGCEACGGTGFAGRVGIFELLPLGDQEARIPTDVGALYGFARMRGWCPMLDDGVAKVREGMTSLEEIGRVLAR